MNHRKVNSKLQKLISNSQKPKLSQRKLNLNRHKLELNPKVQPYSKPAEQEIKFVYELCFRMVNLGINNWVLCPGARNALLIEILIKYFSVKIWTHPDERSASFFALGLCHKLNQPCGVVVTSGTAVTECFSAVVEAFYQNLPLWIITADRPLRYKNSGAPQSIDQYNIFKDYAQFMTLDSLSKSKKQINPLFKIDPKKPVQLNIHLEEPQSFLKELDKFSLKNIRNTIVGHKIYDNHKLIFEGEQKLEKKYKHELGAKPAYRSEDIYGHNQDQEQDQDHDHDHDHGHGYGYGIKFKQGQNKQIALAIKKLNKIVSDPLFNPIIIIGPIVSDLYKKQVENFLEHNYQGLFVAETTASIKISKQTKSRQLFCPSQSLEYAFKNKIFNCVIRIGNTPTLRFWRDLEEKYNFVEVVNFSENGFPGLSRKTKIINFNINQIKALNIGGPRPSEVSQITSINNELIKLDRKLWREKVKLYNKYPQSEWGLLYHLSHKTKIDYLYLGNSLPVRQWDEVACDYSYSNVWHHRGANGIDGQLSSFLGSACYQKGNPKHNPKQILGVFGDLTAFYDLQSLWWVDQIQNATRPIGIVIINNQGGQIFREVMGDNKLYSNAHKINFKNWASMFEVNYKSVRSVNDFKKMASSGPIIIELFVNAKQTQKLSLELKKLNL